MSRSRAAILFVLVASAPRLRAQTVAPAATSDPNVIWACYVRNSGTVYRIRAKDTPSACTAPTHEIFSFNVTGPTGATGATGAVGPTGPAGPAGVSRAIVVDAATPRAIGFLTPVFNTVLPGGTYVISVVATATGSLGSPVGMSCALFLGTTSSFGGTGAVVPGGGQATVSAWLQSTSPTAAQLRCSGSGVTVQRVILTAIAVSSLTVQ